MSLDSASEPRTEGMMKSMLWQTLFLWLAHGSFHLYINVFFCYHTYVGIVGGCWWFTHILRSEDAFQACWGDRDLPADPLPDAPAPNDVGVGGDNAIGEEPPVPSTPPAGPVPPPADTLPEGAPSPVPSPSTPPEAGPAEPASPKWDPLRPSCPQVTWDPAIDESQRPRGLTPEADAYWAYHNAMRDAKPSVDEKSVPSTVEDSPKDNAMVCISDDEDDLSRQDLSKAFDEVADKEGASGFLLEKIIEE